MKLVINNCFGGFSISRAAADFMAARGNKYAQSEIAKSEKEGKWYGYGYGSDEHYEQYDRADPDLVAAVEQLGEQANGSSAKLKVVEIPDGIEWEIDEYDGREQVAEKHRTWG